MNKMCCRLLSYLAFFIFVFLFSSLLKAQEMVKSPANDFQWRLIGRALIDGGIFIEDKVDRGNTGEIVDLRLGTCVTFQRFWDAKIEIGYARNRLSMKDVYLGYSTNLYSVKLGHYFEPFGNARVGSTNIRLMTVSNTEVALGNRRKLGISYSYNKGFFNFMGGAFNDGDVGAQSQYGQGYSLSAKAIARFWVAERRLVHLGAASRFSEHNKQENESVIFSVGTPTDLLLRTTNPLIEADVSNVINQWKWDMEVIGLYNKWYFQSEYMLAHVNRYGGENYNGWGCYAQAGYLVCGTKYNYNYISGMLLNPGPKSLEVLFRYNITNLTDKNAGITGGKMQDLTAGASYFFNQYVAAKLNYSYIMVGSDAPNGADNFHVMQARVQFSF